MKDIANYSFGLSLNFIRLRGKYFTKTKGHSMPKMASSIIYTQPMHICSNKCNSYLLLLNNSIFSTKKTTTKKTGWYTCLKKLQLLGLC